MLAEYLKTLKFGSSMDVVDWKQKVVIFFKLCLSLWKLLKLLSEGVSMQAQSRIDVPLPLHRVHRQPVYAWMNPKGLE